MIEFDYSKLKKNEQILYDKLTDKQKSDFEKKWIKIEQQKKKTEQAKAQLKRFQKEQSEKERKARTRHLIEVGGIVEKYVSITNMENFEEYIKKYKFAIENTQKQAVQETENSSAASPVGDNLSQGATMTDSVFPTESMF